MNSKETDPECRKNPPPLYRAWEFLSQTARVSGALATLVEIRNEHASDCLFGFAVEFDGLPNDDSGSERKMLPVVVGTCM